MTDADIAESRDTHLWLRAELRALVRGGTPSRVGRVGPFLWNFADEHCEDAPVEYRSPPLHRYDTGRR